ncbi:MAG: hypothetical protein J6C13_01110, partial [Clostridia bacterium]|nr:hypothetical protein [Clostridia bacterium]
MSSNRSAKVTISIIVSVVLLLAIVGTILLLIPKDNKPNGTLATMLDAPVNVSIDDNWKLTFDAVPNAVSYQIYVNGSPTKVVSGTTVDMSAYANVGKQGFAVQALHNLPSCNSTLSETVFKVKTLQLRIPQDLELTNSALFWGSVSGAKSYVLQIRYGNNEVQTSHSITSEFDFTTFLQQNSQITHFAVSVKATSVDVATNLRNEYILDSEFSEPKYYYKINSIDAPVISSTFTTPNQQGTDKIITWETDYFVQKYDVYLDNQLVKTIAYSEYENEDVYRLNLKELGVGDELGDHKVYIIATPKTNEGVETFTKKSNEIDYRVQYKLATPDSSTIRLVKEGTSLIIEWDEVVAPSGYTPTYNIKIGGKTNPDDVTSTYIDFKTVQNYKDNYYPFELSSLEATYKEFAVKVQACVDSSEYIINSDFSEYSAPAQAITKLNTPEGIVVGESAGIYTISWQAVNSSAVYGYFIEVYPAQEVAGQLELGERVLYVTVGADKQTRLTITDKLTEAGLQAGKYAFKITTLSNSRYYQNSDQSAAYQFVHKTRLATPVITTCQKQDENNNTSPITFKWTAVENAESYIITVDSTTFTIDQPEGISAGQEITDIQKVSSVVSLYSEPKVFLITIQAIADSADDKHLNSIVSEVYSFRNTFKHQSVQNVQFSASGNNVNISWDAVSTVANLNSYYLVLINGKHSVRTASTSIEGASVSGAASLVKYSMLSSVSGSSSFSMIVGRSR